MEQRLEWVVVNKMELGTYEGKFNRNSFLGFEKGKTYTFELDKKPNQPYDIYEESGLYLILSSEASINYYFTNLKKI